MLLGIIELIRPVLLIQNVTCTRPVLLTHNVTYTNKTSAADTKHKLH